jgi:hypothetical protein
MKTAVFKGTPEAGRRRDKKAAEIVIENKKTPQRKRERRPTRSA